MKIISTEPLLKTQFLNINATEYKDTKDNQKFWVWCQRPNSRKAVVIVAVVDKGWIENSQKQMERDLRLVVIKEFRVPLADYEWGFPAGLVDGEEHVIESAIRELEEETGLNVKTVLRKSPFIYNSAGLTDESIAMVYVECEGEPSKKGLEDSEDIETFLMTRAEVYNLMHDTNKKFGAKFWIVADNFVRNNEI